MIRYDRTIYPSLVRIFIGLWGGGVTYKQQSVSVTDVRNVRMFNVSHFSCSTSVWFHSFAIRFALTIAGHRASYVMPAGFD